jgi:hypothetical protein
MTLKIPGWGICRVLDTRTKDGIKQGLLDLPNQEAPFWVDLKEIARYKGRVIYSDNTEED